MLVKLHDRLRQDAVDAYDLTHLDVPAAVIDGIRRAGIVDWTIWREGVDLYQLIECFDWWSASVALAENTPSDWAEQMHRLVDPSFVPAPPRVVIGSWRLRRGQPERFI
jgi:L-rhamnose mutarotase